MSYQHIHPDFQHILLLSDQERIAFLDAPRWIGYQRAQTILDTLQGLMQKPKRPRSTRLVKPPKPQEKPDTKDKGAADKWEEMGD